MRVTRIGLPVEYSLKNKEPNLEWIRQSISKYDLYKQNSFEDLLTNYLDVHHEGIEVLYTTKAMRMKHEDIEMIRWFSDKTGLSMKLITYMMIIIEFNRKDD